jgi:hypothetical protein
MLKVILAILFMLGLGIIYLILFHGYGFLYTMEILSASLMLWWVLGENRALDENRPKPTKQKVKLDSPNPPKTRFTV